MNQEAKQSDLQHSPELMEDLEEMMNNDLLQTTDIESVIVKIEDNTVIGNEYIFLSGDLTRVSGIIQDVRDLLQVLKGVIFVL